VSTAKAAVSTLKLAVSAIVAVSRDVLFALTFLAFTCVSIIAPTPAIRPNFKICVFIVFQFLWLTNSILLFRNFKDASVLSVNHFNWLLAGNKTKTLRKISKDLLKWLNPFDNRAFQPPVVFCVTFF
jgi:hypothetical protein